MASSAAAPNATGAQQVLCETSDKRPIPAEVDDLRLSHTFAGTYASIDIEEPVIFPVRNIHSREFIRVIDWCKEHKGQADPIVEKDSFTQEEKWFEFTDFEHRFLSVTVPALLELIKAADFLEIRSLYEYGCQAIAERIKGKQPFEVRQILHQADDLSVEDIVEIFERSIWPGSNAEFQDQLIGISEPIDVLPKVLVKVFQKLPREDLERFQLVSRRFRNVIQRELSEKQGPLRPVDVTIGLGIYDDHYVTLPDNGNSEVTCPDRDSLIERLKCCTVETLRMYWDSIPLMSGYVLASLGPFKRTWKNATVVVDLDHFLSKADFDFAFTEVFLCNEIELWGKAHFEPHSLLRLPAILQCNKLNIYLLRHSVAANDALEWVEREKPEQWDEPTFLEVDADRVVGGAAGLVDALKKAFLKAVRPNAYTVRIEDWPGTPADDEQYRNKTTKEQLTIKRKMERKYDDDDEEGWYIVLERKHLD